MMTTEQLRSAFTRIARNSQPAAEGNSRSREIVRFESRAVSAHYTEALKGKLSPTDHNTATVALRYVSTYLD